MEDGQLKTIVWRFEKRAVPLMRIACSIRDSKDITLGFYPVITNY
jgi:hypothetical protein